VPAIVTLLLLLPLLLLWLVAHVLLHDLVCRCQPIFLLLPLPLLPALFSGEAAVVHKGVPLLHCKLLYLWT
jgi:hypothetical protein